MIGSSILRIVRFRSPLAVRECPAQSSRALDGDEQPGAEDSPTWGRYEPVLPVPELRSRADWQAAHEGHDLAVACVKDPGKVHCTQERRQSATVSGWLARLPDGERAFPMGNGRC